MNEVCKMILAVFMLVGMVVRAKADHLLHTLCPVGFVVVGICSSG